MLVETFWLESYRNQYFVKYRVGGCKVIESCRYGNRWNLMRGRCSQKYGQFEMLQSRRAKLLADLFRTQECQYGWVHQWLMSLCWSFKGGQHFHHLVCTCVPRPGLGQCLVGGIRSPLRHWNCDRPGVGGLQTNVVAVVGAKAVGFNLLVGIPNACQHLNIEKVRFQAWCLMGGNCTCQQVLYLLTYYTYISN